MGTSKGKRAQSRGAGAIADGATHGSNEAPGGEEHRRPAHISRCVRTRAAARGVYKGLTGPLNNNVIGIMTYSERSMITSETRMC